MKKWHDNRVTKLEKTLEKQEKSMPKMGKIFAVVTILSWMFGVYHRESIFFILPTPIWLLYFFNKWSIKNYKKMVQKTKEKHKI